METESLTQTLALWGAVTGTIGTVAGIANLALRFKQHKKDQPKLLCTSEFSFEHSAGVARPQHKLIIRSVGKRPVTVDYVRYFINPKGFWQSLFKQRAWNKNRWIYDDQPRSAMHITGNYSGRHAANDLFGHEWGTGNCQFDSIKDLTAILSQCGYVGTDPCEILCSG